jgi:adhesin/invasin
LVTLPGTAGNGLLVGDVNGDGLPDLVSAGGYVDYGIGGGYFTNPISYPVGGGSEHTNVVLADLLRNGQTDIITGSYFAISVLLNLGKGFFEDGIWTNVTGGAGCGAAADFNRDGKPDLAVDNANGVSILLGTGKYLTPFSAGTNIALPGAACLITGDLNGDGIPDLLVPVNGTPPAVNAYLGNGDGTFTLKSTTPTPSGGYLALGDFNHDGRLDFVSSGNLMALGNGDGTFQNPTTILSSSPGFSGIAVGDINNDGWPDLVLTTNGYVVNTVLLNNRQGGFTEASTSFGQYSAQPILLDLNGDGYLDLTEEQTAGGEAAIYLGDGKGGFTFQVALAGPIPNVSGTYCVADVNGDGILDVLVLEANTLNIYLGEGSAKYAASVSIGTGPSYGSLLVENLHGQSSKAGIPDIVEPDSSGGVMVLFNLTP